MLEFFLILLVATVCVLGWWAGNTFVCVFLSLPIIGFMLLLSQAGGPAVPNWMGGCIIALVAIWAPRIVRLLNR